MEEQYITDRDIFYLNFFDYGTPFFGSFRGMNYRLVRVLQKEESPAETAQPPRETKLLEAVVWKGPQNFAATKQEKQTRRFSFSEEGYANMLQWLNEVYRAGLGTWK